MKIIAKIILGIEAVLISIAYILTLLITQGPSLYELLIITISLTFLVIGIDIWKLKHGLSLNQKITIMLTMVIAYFAIAQTWTTLYETIPRVYGPTLSCPNPLYITPDGYGNFSVSFGNYGQLPAWITADFENITNSLSVIQPNKIPPIVLLPIAYENDEQHQFLFNFKITSYTAQNFGFKFRYLYFGDDIIDKELGLAKILLNIYSELPCPYIMINNTTLKLKN
jgi:hypothetical protein